MAKDKRFYIDLVSKHCYGTFNTMLLITTEDLDKLAEKLAGQVEPEVRPENGDFKDIIIEYSKTKRRLNIPFAVCGGKKELTQMARKILKKAKHKDFIYGWIDVVGKPEPIKNTAPKNWDE